MAKGNLLLGTAANSVGDVVMYRREGAQVSRVRVRKVKNPKTKAQSLQRAAFAPVAKFYSPLSIVLERSFEGLSKAKSYAKFLKTNVDLARANDWLLPKGTGFFPLPYKLSSGSLPAIPQSIETNQMVSFLRVGAGSASESSTFGEFSQFFVELGAQNGDIITFIGIAKSTTGEYVPGSWQFEVDTTSQVEFASPRVGLCKIVAETGVTMETPNANGTFAAGAVIIARYQNNVWRRGSQALLVIETILTQIAESTYRDAAIASYGATNTGDNPLVYLDGEELNG